MPLRSQGRRGNREDERHRPKQKTAERNDHLEFLLERVRIKRNEISPRKQQIVRRTGCEGRWVFRECLPQANPKSSHLETGNDGDGLCRPRSSGFGRDYLHLRPVVRELAAAIEANNVSPGYGGCCTGAAQLAAHGDGEAARFVPTTEDQIEQTHKPSSIEATTHAASRHFSLVSKSENPVSNISGRFRTGYVNRARVASTNRLHQAKTQSRR